MARLKFVLAFDFETSNLPENGGQPIEIAALLLDPKSLLEVDFFHRFMRLEEGEEIDQVAFEKHGKTREWLQDNGESRESVTWDFIRWLMRHGVRVPTTGEEIQDLGRQLQPLGQNIAFDLQFMVPLLRRHMGEHAHRVFTHHVLDTMPLAAFINQAMIRAFGFQHAPFKDFETGYPSASLEAQVRAIGGDVETLHGALADIRFTAQAYRHHLQSLADDFTAARKWHNSNAK